MGQIAAHSHQLNAENVMMPFGEVLEVADKLSLNEQETLIEVLQRRIIERRREELAKQIQVAQQEFLAGRCRPVTSRDLTREILIRREEAYLRPEELLREEEVFGDV